MDLFNKIIPVILKSEGGYQQDPDDLGNWTGPNKTGLLKGTKYGICARYFPDIDIVNLTLKQAEQIYFDNYWKPMNLKGIRNQELVLHIFDHGVNAGKRTAIRMIQRIVYTGPDGIVVNLQQRRSMNLSLLQKSYRVTDCFQILSIITNMPGIVIMPTWFAGARHPVNFSKAG